MAQAAHQNKQMKEMQDSMRKTTQLLQVSAQLQVWGLQGSACLLQLA
jgi:hypothetical protein